MKASKCCETGESSRVNEWKKQESQGKKNVEIERWRQTESNGEKTGFMGQRVSGSAETFRALPLMPPGRPLLATNANVAYHESKPLYVPCLCATRYIRSAATADTATAQQQHSNSTPGKKLALSTSTRRDEKQKLRDTLAPHITTEAKAQRADRPSDGVQQYCLSCPNHDNIKKRASKHTTRHGNTQISKTRNYKTLVVRTG